MGRSSRAARECSAIHECKKTPSPLAATHITILVVEDESFVRHATGELLNGLGYHALLAEDIASAKRVFASCHQEVDLLLCDAVLPDGSGIELAEFLSASSPDLKVVMVSGYPQAALKRMGAERSAHFLSKPYTASFLILRIEIALKGQPIRTTFQVPDPAAKELSDAP